MPMMIKRYFYKPLSYFLLLAFLVLQWSATHIHLAAEHAHDGDQHQHAATAHQHQTISEHIDAIDVAEQALSHVDGHQVVELEHDCTQLKLKKTFQLAAIASTNCCPFQTQVTSDVIPVSGKRDNYQTYHQYTSVRLRAPPVFS